MQGKERRDLSLLNQLLQAEKRLQESGILPIALANQEPHDEGDDSLTIPEIKMLKTLLEAQQEDELVGHRGDSLRDAQAERFRWENLGHWYLQNHDQVARWIRRG